MDLPPMRRLIERELGDRIAVIGHTTRADGDLSTSTVQADVLAARRAEIIGMPWHVVRQVHSDRVVNVANSKPSPERPVADAIVTSCSQTAIAVHSGDCVPVGFISNDGAIGVAHAGWKGLEAGVLESTVRGLGGDHIVAAIGPHIHRERYEFGQADLDRLVKRLGPHAQGQTSAGNPALDLTASVVGELNRLGVEVAAVSPDCTADRGEHYWSHRARSESGRIALVAWIEEPV